MAVITLGLQMISFLQNSLQGDLYTSVLTLLSSPEFGWGQWDYARAAMKFPYLLDFTIFYIDNMTKDTHAHIIHLFYFIMRK